MVRLAKTRASMKDVNGYRMVDTGTAKPPRKKPSRLPETRVESAGVTDSSGNGKSKDAVVRSKRQPLLTGSTLTTSKGGKLDR